MLQVLFAVEVPFPHLWGTEVAVACGFLHGRRRYCSSRRVFRVKFALTKEKHGQRVLSNCCQEVDEWKGYSTPPKKAVYFKKQQQFFVLINSWLEVG